MLFKHLRFCFLFQVDDSTRSRLYSLKQMGVDKLASLRQRFTEGRGPRRDSQTSDTASESSHSDSLHSGLEMLPHLCDTFVAPQFAKNRCLFSAFYKPTSLLTVIFSFCPKTNTPIMRGNDG